MVEKNNNISNGKNQTKNTIIEDGKEYKIKWFDYGEPGDLFEIYLREDNTILVVNYLKGLFKETENTEIEISNGYGKSFYPILEDISYGKEDRLYLDLEEYEYRILAEKDPYLYYVYYKSDDTFKVVKCELDSSENIYYEKMTEYIINLEDTNYKKIKIIFDKKIEENKNMEYFCFGTNDEEEKDYFIKLLENKNYKIY